MTYDNNGVLVLKNKGLQMITEITLMIVIACLLVVIFIDRRQAHQREKDLLNRLMATDFKEYVQGTVHLDEEPEGVPTAEDVATALQEDMDGYSPGGVPAASL